MEKKDIISSGRRLSTYVDPVVAEWIDEEREKLKWSRSFFIYEQLREAMARHTGADDGTI